MNKELGGKIMKDFAVLRAKAYKYLTYNHDDNKNRKGKKRCTIKRKRRFEDYIHCLETNQL